jgi:tetratricopeptide (TPR) repeat protein
VSISSCIYVDVHRKQGHYKEAKELYYKSLKQAELLVGKNHPSIAEIKNNLGMLLKKEGQYEIALEHLKHALKIYKHFFGQKHPSIGISLTNVGDIYRKVISRA